MNLHPVVCICYATLGSLLSHSLVYNREAIRHNWSFLRIFTIRKKETKSEKVASWNFTVSLIKKTACTPDVLFTGAKNGTTKTSVDKNRKIHLLIEAPASALALGSSSGFARESFWYSNALPALSRRRAVLRSVWSRAKLQIQNSYMLSISNYRLAYVLGTARVVCCGITYLLND